MRRVVQGFMEEVALQLVRDISLSTQETESMPSRRNRLCKDTGEQRHMDGRTAERVILGRTVVLQV